MLHLAKLVLIKRGLMAFFALGIGYLVCIGASKEKGLVKSIGYFIGIVIIAGSLFVEGVKIYRSGTCKGLKEKMSCHRMGPQQMVKESGTVMPPTK